jgi:hypothetical protein
MSVPGCNLADSEYYSMSILAEVHSLSVPDSSRYNDIRVRMTGLLGTTSAVSFERITVQTADSSIELAVYGRQIYDSGKRYDVLDVKFDTTLVVSVPQPSRARLYAFRLLGANQILRDSSFVR